MKTLNEYLKEEKKITLPDFEDIKESLLDDPEDQFNKYKDDYDVLKMMIDNEVFYTSHFDVKKALSEDPIKFIKDLLGSGFIKVYKNGKNYKVDLNYNIDVHVGGLTLNSNNSKLPIEIGKIKHNIGVTSIRFSGIKDIPVNWIPEEIESGDKSAHVSIVIENKRFSLDLSKRPTALSKLPKWCNVVINNNGGVTADKIIWNNNPIIGHLSIYTKFDNKTEISLPKIEGDLTIGKTGMKYYMEKLNVLNDPQLIKKVFGSNCEIKRLCE